MKRLLTIFAFAIITICSINAKETRLLRYPNASKTQITFCYGGDLYIVGKDGGLARKITNSIGIERTPRFSNDGSQIAFSAEYDGNVEIYTMPSIGGEPQRITYSMDIQGLPERMGPDKIIMQWTKDDKRILFSSRSESWHAWSRNLFFLDAKGGMPEVLPLPRTGFASLSGDGKKLAYNRVFREYRTWKRYRGGQADDIWIYDFNTKKIENITNNKAQDIIPIWHKDKIYFLSDRDHTMNLFVYDINSKQTKKLTNFDKYDVKFPSLGVDCIAFENGGYVYLMDFESEQAKKIDIEIAEDFVSARSSFVDVKDRIYNYDFSPDGSWAMFGARGDIFVVPMDMGTTKNLTQTSGIHERNIEWSPDGKWLAFISDKTGEDEVYIIRPDGSNLTQLTNNSKSYRYEIRWSPDSKYLLNSDKLMNLYLIDVDMKKVTTITKSKSWEIRDFSWSPDSKWVAYTDNLNNSLQSIYLYSLESGKSTLVTDEFFDCANPCFSDNGKYLFFVSNRAFNPTISNIEWNFSMNNMSQIYGITLQKNCISPFLYDKKEATPLLIKEPEVTDAKDAKKSSKKIKEKEDISIIINLDRIKERIFEFPLAAANYYNLLSVNDKLYYGRNGIFYNYDLKEKEENKVGDFGGCEISTDKKKIMFSQNREYYICPLKDNIKPDEKNKVDLSDLKVLLDRKEEWKQVYNESWRQMRDFFYDPNMHGVDWKAIHDKYAELLPFVINRDDLTYIIGEMIGELNCGHAYTGGGDAQVVSKVQIGLLGAEFEFDNNAKLFKIKKIFEGRNWEEKTRSPLTEPGITVKEGDYIFAIDGIKLSENLTPYQALVNKVNKYVNLKTSVTKNEADAKESMVKTISSETGLRYFYWVETNRKKVEKATNGRVAYVHVPDMGVDNGLIEFVKYFYPQVRKEGLIIDDRYNGGGNVSPMLIERLKRILVVAKSCRNQEEVGTNPDNVMTGPMVCLINELSASDGDLFPYQFKTLGLGKLIGKRSWGGVIGIRGSNPFLDGGYLNKPEFANFGADGTWILEGVGIEPDIVVDNDPAKEWEGIDEQLNKAIEVVLEEIKTNKKPTIPKVPPYPDKK